jgi:glycosyltransferase involved in cell wall biosynthesis
VPDGPLHRFTARVARWLPPSFTSFVSGQFISVIDQRRAARVARALIAQHGITVVHQPVPVSPKQVSALRNLGVPIVMGPMNGGITYPPGFRGREAWFDRAFVPLGRMVAGLAHRLFPGKLEAAALLVANSRTARSLPRGVRGRVEHIVENGVNLGVYQGAPKRPTDTPPRSASGTADAAPVRFAFAGRLVDWKAVDLLLEAVARARKEVAMTLEIMGDGPWRHRLERQSAECGLADAVRFRGWMTHQDCADVLGASDVFVLPSLHECGGAVVLEAMAMGLPVIASNWGGPADYVDETCGILVSPQHKEQFINDLAAAMVRLAKSPETRRSMGDAGYQKVVAEYDWERKIERVTEIYRDALRHARAT